MPQILPDDGIAEGINSLNSKQREVFDVVHSWVKDYVKYDGHNVEPIHFFFFFFFFQVVEAQVNLIW